METLEKIRKTVGCCNATLKQYVDSFQNWDACWDQCERGDWMLWIIWLLINKHDDNQCRDFFLAKAQCAMQVWDLMRHYKSRLAVQAAKNYGLRTIERQELIPAANEAYDIMEKYARDAVSSRHDVYLGKAYTLAYTYALYHAASAAYSAAFDKNAGSDVVVVQAACDSAYNVANAVAAAKAGEALAYADANNEYPDPDPDTAKKSLAASAEIVREIYTANSIEKLAQDKFPTKGV